MVPDDMVIVPGEEDSNSEPEDNATDPGQGNKCSLVNLVKREIDFRGEFFKHCTKFSVLVGEKYI